MDNHKNNHLWLTIYFTVNCENDYVILYHHFDYLLIEGELIRVHGYNKDIKQTRLGYKQPDVVKQTCSLMASIKLFLCCY